MIGLRKTGAEAGPPEAPTTPRLLYPYQNTRLATSGGFVIIATPVCLHVVETDFVFDRYFQWAFATGRQKVNGIVLPEDQRRAARTIEILRR